MQANRWPQLGGTVSGATLVAKQLPIPFESDTTARPVRALAEEPTRQSSSERGRNCKSHRTFTAPAARLPFKPDEGVGASFAFKVVNTVTTSSASHHVHCPPPLGRSGNERDCALPGTTRRRLLRPRLWWHSSHWCGRERVWSATLPLQHGGAPCGSGLSLVGREHQRSWPGAMGRGRSVAACKRWPSWCSDAAVIVDSICKPVRFHQSAGQATLGPRFHNGEP